MKSLFKITLNKGSQTAIVTGFLIDKEGHVLTAGHSFSELEQIIKKLAVAQ